MTDPQEQIRKYLLARGIATSVDLERMSWDFRKIISRLRKKMPIETRRTPGRKYATYVLIDGEQMRLI